MIRFALLLLLTVPALAEDKKPVADADFDGTYTITSGEKDGEMIPEDRIKGTKVRFEGSKITTVDKDSKEVYVATFTAQDSKAKTIAIKSTIPKEYSAVGMIEKTKDEIKLIYALPDGPAPTQFKTAKGQQMFVLKLAKSEKQEK